MATLRIVLPAHNASERDGLGSSTLLSKPFGVFSAGEGPGPIEFLFREPSGAQVEDIAVWAVCHHFGNLFLAFELAELASPFFAHHG